MIHFYQDTTVANSKTHRHTALPLRVNFAWTLIGNIVYAGCQWGMLSALAKLGTPEMVGQFALGLAITAPIILFSNLSLRSVQSTDALREYHFGEYLALRLTTSLLALGVISGIAFGVGDARETSWIVLLLGLAKALESLSDVFYGLFQQYERMDRIAYSLLGRGCLGLALFGLGIYLTDSVLGGIVGLVVAWGLILVVYDVPSGALVLNLTSRFGAWQPIWNTQKLLRLAKRALPLGFTMMLISLNANIPRYFIQGYSGERELGFFAAMAYLMVAGTTVVNALGQSASPRLADYYAKDNVPLFRQLLLKLMGIGIFLGIAGVLLSWIAGQEILTLLYRQEYATFSDALVWLTVATGISYIASFLGYAMTAAHYYRIQPLILIVTVASSALFCFLLVPAYGILGAVWAIGLASILQALGSLGCVVRAIRQKEMVSYASGRSC